MFNEQPLGGGGRNTPGSPRPIFDGQSQGKLVALYIVSNVITRFAFAVTTTRNCRFNRNKIGLHMHTIHSCLARPRGITLFLRRPAQDTCFPQTTLFPLQLQNIFFLYMHAIQSSLARPGGMTFFLPPSSRYLNPANSSVHGNHSLLIFFGWPPET